MQFMFIVFFILFVAVLIFSIINIYKSSKTPSQTIYGKVISKEKYMRAYNMKLAYRITFEVNGQLLVLRTYASLFNLINEGEEGTLTYKGTWLEYFTKKQ